MRTARPDGCCATTRRARRCVWKRADPREGEAYLAFGSLPQDGSAVFQLSASRDLREAASRLFALLRAADATAPSAIAVAPIPDHGLGEAINDRLRRAAGHVG